MQFGADSHNPYEAGKIIVAIHRDPDSPNASGDAAGRVLNELAYEKAEYIFRSNGTGGEDGGLDLILVHLNSRDGAAVDDAVERLSANPHVAYAEPDYLEDLHLIPDDPLNSRLWGLQNIHAPAAWNYTTGSDQVAVGVIDTGIDHMPSTGVLVRKCGSF